MFAEPSFAAQQLQASGSLFFREPQLVLAGLVSAAGDWARVMRARGNEDKESLLKAYAKLHAAWGVYCLNALEEDELPAYYSPVAKCYTLLTLEALRIADSWPQEENLLSYSGSSTPHRSAVFLQKELQALGRGEKTPEELLERFRDSALQSRLYEAYEKGELFFSAAHRKTYDFWDTEVARPFVTLELKLNAYDRFKQLKNLLDRFYQEGLLDHSFLTSDEHAVLKNHIFFPEAFAIAPLEAAFTGAKRRMNNDGLTHGKLPAILEEFEGYFQRYSPHYGTFYGKLSMLKSLLQAADAFDSAMNREARKLIELTPQVEDEVAHYGRFMKLFAQLRPEAVREHHSQLLEELQVEYAVLALLHGEEREVHA